MELERILNDSILVLPSYLWDANKRIFGVYLLSALLLAIPAYWLQRKNLSLTGFARYVFHPKVWGHRSAKLDYGLFIVNRLVRAILWAPLLFTMVPIALGLSDALEWLFGTLTPLSSNQSVVIASFTFILFILDDLTRFILHLLMHKVPMLWDFHKVHHSALVMTPMTIYRSHPFESYLYACRMALAQGVAVGLGYYLFGPQLSMFDVLGANVFVFIFNVMGSNLRHSHVPWGWGKRIENWFISPKQHQIHHSTRPEHFDKNLGSALAIWDRMAGTLVKSDGVGRLRFGLGKRQAPHLTLTSAYVQPFLDINARITKRFKKPAASKPMPQKPVGE